MAQPVLHFMIVGQDDHPLFEADLVSRSDASGREVRVERAGGGRRQGLGAGATALPSTAHHSRRAAAGRPHSRV